MTPVLEVAGVTVRLGAATVLHDVSFDVEPGSVVGLIGPNGAGKSTLLDVLSGFLDVHAGRVGFDGAPLLERHAHERARLGIARSFQSQELFDDLSVAENLQVAADGAGVDPAAVAALADDAGVDASDPRPVRALSTGERAAVALARALVSRPRLLLLDEPAAGLDVDARRRLAAGLRRIAATGTAVLLIDHDLALVLDVCDRVVVLDLGRVVADGPPDRIRDDPTVVAVYVGAGVPQADRAPRPVRGEPTAAVRARTLTAGYGAGAVVRDVDLDVGAGEVVALLGPNGAGKTTTLLALSGVLRDVAGDVRILGSPLRPGRAAAGRGAVAHVLQTRRVFGDLTVRENLRLVGASAAATDAALDTFPSLRPLLGRRAGQLSGGEQQMLALARAFATDPRLLVVDELSLGLAPKVVATLLSTIRAAADERGTAVLLAEQHAPLALGIADRGYVLAAGRVTASGSAADLAADPSALLRAYLGDT